VAEHERNSGDLIVKPGSFVYLLDETKGNISVITGPQKLSMSTTDKTVIFDEESNEFKAVTPSVAIQQFINVRKGSYVILDNPEKSGKNPQRGTNSPYADLDIGCSVNIPGPASFALWPGQQATVIEGHNLRSNEYLVCRVIDEAEAKANKDQAIVVPQQNIDETIDQSLSPAEQEERKHEIAKLKEEAEKNKRTKSKNSPSIYSNLTTGSLFIIKGTDVSFYIPPTGIEVIPEDSNEYIRRAVTLEQLEYCILLSEGGDKRYEYGPQVVFPGPTETFMWKTQKQTRLRKFKAVELNELSGIYIKVIDEYTENGTVYQKGEELFLTGKDHKIYYPRPEHSIIKYGDRDIHYAVAIPAGEARYVLDRESGEISVIEGPRMFLPDPRKQVLVRRVLGSDTVSLWFPNNREALAYNESLSQLTEDDGSDFLTERSFVAKTSSLDQYSSTDSRNNPYSSALLRSASRTTNNSLLASYDIDDNFPITEAAAAAGVMESTRTKSKSKNSVAKRERAVTGEAVGEVSERKATFTRPISVTLDSKFDGAVRIQVWTGYAVQILDGAGNRRVLVGPTVTHLKYDEILEKFKLSAGTPKSPSQAVSDVYLRVLNNRVNDKIIVETSDMVKVELQICYTVDFTEDETKWFNVENYVQHLCDHGRSIIRNIAKSHDIQTFYANYIDIIRGVLLGKSYAYNTKQGTLIEHESQEVLQDTPKVQTSRSGRLFEENGMLIKEVELLNCNIQDINIQNQLLTSQREIAANLISITRKKADFELDQVDSGLAINIANLKAKTIEETEKAKQREIAANRETAIHKHNLELEKVEQSGALQMLDMSLKTQLVLAQVAQSIERERTQVDGDLSMQDTLNQISEAELARREKDEALRLQIAQKETEDYLVKIKAEAEAQVEQVKAIDPQLTAALQAFASSSMMEQLAQHLAPLSIVKGQSLGTTISEMFQGTALEDTVRKLTNKIEKVT